MVLNTFFGKALQLSTIEKILIQSNSVIRNSLGPPKAKNYSIKQGIKAHLGPKIQQYFARCKRELSVTVIVITEFDFN